MTDVNELIKWVPTLAAIVAMYFAIKGGRRSETHDAAESIKQNAEVKAQLAMLLQVVTDINSKFDSQQRQLNDLSERVVRVEECTKSVRERLDGIERGN